MKRIIAFALALMITGAASAATLNWGATGQIFIGTQSAGTVGADPYGSLVTGYLVYLGGAGSTWGDVDAAGIAAGTVTEGVVASGTTTAFGTLLPTANPVIVAEGAAIPGSSTGTFDLNDATFGILFVTVEASPQYITYGTFLHDESTNYAAATQTYTWGPAVPSGTSWTPVPEPGTIMLALCGFGTMVVRRFKKRS